MWAPCFMNHGKTGDNNFESWWNWEKYWWWLLESAYLKHVICILCIYIYSFKLFVISLADIMIPTRLFDISSCMETNIWDHHQSEWFSVCSVCLGRIGLAASNNLQQVCPRCDVCFLHGHEQVASKLPLATLSACTPGNWRESVDREKTQWFWFNSAEDAETSETWH